METGDNGSWYSITDALERLNVSRRTLYDRINKEELTAKKEGRNRFVWLDDTTETSTIRHTKQSKDVIKQLELRLEYFQNRVETLELELSDQRQRHDTIILRMTDQNQLLLESVRKPFWRFW